MHSAVRTLLAQRFIAFHRYRKNLLSHVGATSPLHWGPTKLTMQSLKHTIAENLGVAPTRSGDPHKLVEPQHYFDLGQVGDLSDKVALVTGGE